MFSCDGCRSKFNRQGDLIQHLQKSENLLCTAAREALQQKMRPIRGGPTRNPLEHRMATPLAGPSSESVEEHSPARFEGDFFGNASDYDDADFPFPECDIPVGSGKVDVEEKSVCSDSEDEDEDYDEDEDFDMADLEAQTSGHARNHQQPPDPRAPSVPPVAAELNADNNRPNDHACAPGGVSIEGHNLLKKAPAYVTKFGGQAGKPLSVPSLPRMTGYSGYAEQTGSREHIWAPFKSKLEWEIAQWAKLRGPGATSFTELLDIEGVS
jgi:hypothetical protein